MTRFMTILQHINTIWVDIKKDRWMNIYMHTYLITVCNYNPTIDLAKNVSKECVFPELFKKESDVSNIIQVRHFLSVTESPLAPVREENCQDQRHSIASEWTLCLETWQQG